MHCVKRLVLGDHARLLGEGGFLEREPGRREQIGVDSAHSRSPRPVARIPCVRLAAALAARLSDFRYRAAMRQYLG